MISVSAALHVGMIALLVFVPAHWWQRPLETARQRDDDQPRRRARSAQRRHDVDQLASDSAGRRGSPEGDAEPAAGGEDAGDGRADREAEAGEGNADADPRRAEGIEHAQTDGRRADAGRHRRRPRPARQTNSIGLSTGGGGTGGQINVGNFCCPEYIAGMVSKVHQNWNSRQSSAGITTMQFTIQRDGTLTEIRVAAVERQSDARLPGESCVVGRASVAAAAGGIYESYVGR